MSEALSSACEMAMHVIRSDGRVYRAGRAVLFILEQLGWGWGARLLSCPPFIWLVEWLYRLVARHRGFFARYLLKQE